MSKNTAQVVQLVNHAAPTSLSGQSGLSHQSGLSGAKPRRPHPPGERADDRMWANQLRARHGDLIARYAQRRLGSLDQANQVTQAVFAHAAANRSQIAEPALPWLIAAARARCAEYRQRPTHPAPRRP